MQTFGRRHRLWAWERHASRNSRNWSAPTRCRRVRPRQPQHNGTMRAARLLLLLAPLHAQQRRTINDVVSTRPKYSINDVVSRKRSTGRPRVGVAYTRNEVTSGPNGHTEEHHVFELRNAVLSALSVKRAAPQLPVALFTDLSAAEVKSRREATIERHFSSTRL